MESQFNGHLTFTTNVFIPVTFLCRNNCAYCGYRQPKVESGEEFLAVKKIDQLLKKAEKSKVSEILITMGEKPETKYPEAARWLQENGFGSIVEYVYSIAEKALEYGLLPHINAGSLKFDELSYLKEVSASMGVMAEILSTRLMIKGMPHEESPDKHPKTRIKTIKNAGRLKIPFTTGILVGIGETPKEIISSLHALKNIHDKYHHLQEVIIQNFQPHQASRMVNIPSPSSSFLEKIIVVARHILPQEISIQIPPNLIEGDFSILIQSGISDWGGISPITTDYINPDHPWPELTQLQSWTEDVGYKLIERLPVYPQYMNSDWLPQQIYDLIRTKGLSTKEGYRKRPK